MFCQSGEISPNLFTVPITNTATYLPLLTRSYLNCANILMHDNRFLISFVFGTPNRCIWCVRQKCAVWKNRKFSISVEMQPSTAAACIKCILCESALKVQICTVGYRLITKGNKSLFNSLCLFVRWQGENLVFKTYIVLLRCPLCHIHCPWSRWLRSKILYKIGHWLTFSSQSNLC